MTAVRLKTPGSTPLYSNTNEHSKLKSALPYISPIKLGEIYQLPTEEWAVLKGEFTPILMPAQQAPAVTGTMYFLQGHLGIRRVRPLEGGHWMTALGVQPAFSPRLPHTALCVGHPLS